MIINIYILILFNLLISNSDACESLESSTNSNTLFRGSYLPPPRAKNKLKQSSVLVEGSEKANRGLRRLTNPPTVNNVYSDQDTWWGISSLKINSAETGKSLKTNNSYEEGPTHDFLQYTKLPSRKQNNQQETSPSTGFLQSKCEGVIPNQFLKRDVSLSPFPSVLPGGHFRIVLPTDLEALNDLMIDSKKAAGGANYSDEYLRNFRRELSLTPEILKISKAEALVIGNIYIAFYSFYMNPDKQLELDNFFVAAKYLHRGYGKLLWARCLTMATTFGKDSFILWSSPEAVDFYKKRGCVKIGEKASPADRSRIQPLLKFVFGDAGANHTPLLPKIPSPNKDIIKIQSATSTSIDGAREH